MKKVSNDKKLKISNVLLNWALVLGFGFIAINYGGLDHKYITKEIIEYLAATVGVMLGVALYLYYTARNKFMSDYGYVDLVIHTEKLSGKKSIYRMKWPVNAVPIKGDFVDVYLDDGEMRTLRITERRYITDEKLNIKQIYIECLV